MEIGLIVLLGLVLGWIGVMVVLGCIQVISMLLSLCRGVPGAAFWERFAEQCPRCGRATLNHGRWEKTNPPSPNFARCENCGARLKRMFSGPWEDLLGAEDEDERWAWEISNDAKDN